VLRVEVIIGLIASSLAILAFMARAYANIRKGRRIHQYGEGIAKQSEDDLRRLREEIEQAEKNTASKRNGRGRQGT
jgi:hypothetical protein